MTGLLGRFLGFIRGLEEQLGPDDDWVEDDRRILWEWAQRNITPLTGYHFVWPKSKRDYFTTAHVSPDEVEEIIHNGGYERNLISSRKWRDHHDGGKQWAVGSWAFDPPDTKWQHHVFIFPGPNGKTDIYGHKEISVREGPDHLYGDFIPGDPDGRVRELLDSAGVEHRKRDF